MAILLCQDKLMPSRIVQIKTSLQGLQTEALVRGVGGEKVPGVTNHDLEKAVLQTCDDTDLQTSRCLLHAMLNRIFHQCLK